MTDATTQARARRSMLYTPGTRPDRIEKALTAEGGADMVVADLEDAVAPDDKEQARAGTVDVLGRVTGSRAERCVRVNAFGSPWHDDDLEQVMKALPDTIVVPKVDGAAVLARLNQRLFELERAAGIEGGTTEVVAQLETAWGLAAALEIAEEASHLERVTALCWGAEDYAADVGARRTAEGTEVLYARGRVVLAAAIAGVQAIDQVFIDYKDHNGLAQDSQRGRNMGFVGKQVIHPAQLGPVHEAFTPDTNEVRHARALLAAVEAAGIEDGGVIGFEGRMVDRPIIAQARRVADLANALGL